jgi:hypothetical protein
MLQPFRAWLDSRTQPVTPVADWAPTDDLYDDYCRNVGPEHATLHSFAWLMRNHGVRQRQRQIGGNGLRCWNRMLVPTERADPAPPADTTILDKVAAAVFGPSVDLMLDDELSLAGLRAHMVTRDVNARPHHQDIRINNRTFRLSLTEMTEEAR